MLDMVVPRLRCSQTLTPHGTAYCGFAVTKYVLWIIKRLVGESLMGNSLYVN